MLENFIPKLAEDLKLNPASLISATPGVYTLPLEGSSIDMAEIANGYQLKCNVAPFPTKNEEMFATQAMLANLFGQGTRGGILGLSPDGTLLTLTLHVDYPVDYRTFKESLEDFIAAIDVWREEALNPTPLK